MRNANEHNSQYSKLFTDKFESGQFPRSLFRYQNRRWTHVAMDYVTRVVKKWKRLRYLLYIFRSHFPSVVTVVDPSIAFCIQKMKIERKETKQNQWAFRMLERKKKLERRDYAWDEMQKHNPHFVRTISWQKQKKKEEKIARFTCCGFTFQCQRLILLCHFYSIPSVYFPLTEERQRKKNHLPHFGLATFGRA